MFESSNTPNSAANSSANATANYFDLGGGGGGVHHTSVIRHSDEHVAPQNPYYSGGGYGLPLFLGTDFLQQFPPSDLTSPITPTLPSPLTPSPFCGFPTIPGGNQLYNNRTPYDFYSAATSSPMVTYSSKKSAAGRKPKEEMQDNMDDDDDDKKLKRRQRNKEAAARCRQRRLDLMKELQDQVNAFKHINEKKTAECNEIRNKLSSMKAFLESHDCKLTPDERMTQMRAMIIPAPTIEPLSHLRIGTHYHHHSRAGSAAPSVMSNHSSSSSEQHSPIEDYKPSIDQLNANQLSTTQLPPISFMNKDRSMPPPQLPASTSQGMNVITSIPVPHSTNNIIIQRPSDNVFAEPALKIPKLEGMDRTLTSLASPEDLERPSMLPMLSRNPVNQPITTPGRIFRNGEYYQTPQSGSSSLFVGDGTGDFLSTNTGLTPSGQPAMNFVSTPTPIQPSSDHDLRPL